MTAAFHLPVLLTETLACLAPKPGRIFIDMTAGGGGHAQAIGERIRPGGTLLLLDQDPQALRVASERLSGLDITLRAFHTNFRGIAAAMDAAGIGLANGILFDLGVSSHQLDSPERGFSFREDAPLDMRMNPAVGESAAELLARADEATLAQIIREYGEERWAQRIARFLVEERRQRPVETTGQLADLVRRAIPRSAQPRDIHPATRTFQALRIAVNDELGALQEALNASLMRLAPEGRCAVIAYHSLEDRIVKQAFLRFSGRCQCPPGLPECRCGAIKKGEIITRKPVTPTDAEIRQNPRARSAKLRAVKVLSAEY